MDAEIADVSLVALGYLFALLLFVRVLGFEIALVVFGDFLLLVIEPRLEVTQFSGVGSLGILLVLAPLAGRLVFLFALVVIDIRKRFVPVNTRFVKIELALTE